MSLGALSPDAHETLAQAMNKMGGRANSGEGGEDQKRFNTDKKCRVIISNRKTGGAGINLTSAAYSIVYGRDFNLGNELQSEARNYRAGSEAHESITKINLVMEDTIDELVMQALESKQEVSKVILDML